MLTGGRARLIGVGFVLLSAFAWSLNGLYSRVLTVDVWTTLVGRAIATATTLLIALLVIHRGETVPLLRRNARIAVWVVVAGVFTMVTFVAALFTTSVANVTVIYAMSPLIAALLARFLIGDLLVARTMVAFAFAMVGVVIIVGGSLGTDRLTGDLLALLMAAGFAVVIVEMRRKPEIDNVASSFLSSLLLAVLLAPFATLSEVTLHDAAILFLFGFTRNVLGFFLFVAGVRRIPPAEAGLIATVEIVLAPLWVWLLFAENPG
jgi:drug/metabolite transporter (DMT)-like permease